MNGVRRWEASLGDGGRAEEGCYHDTHEGRCVPQRLPPTIRFTLWLKMSTRKREPDTEELNTLATIFGGVFTLWNDKHIK